MNEIVTAVGKLTSNRPEVQVLAATELGVPRPVLLALWEGAGGLLDFKEQTPSEIALQVHEAVGRHRQATYERELLLRLRMLNEDFLRTMIGVEKRNIELEEKLKGEP